MTRWLGALALLALIPATQSRSAPGPQPALVGTAAISGTVVADDKDRTPVRRVTLTLYRSGVVDSRTTATDDKGRYLFTELPAGLYTLTAAKGAYVTTSYGATKAGLPGSPIPIV